MCSSVATLVLRNLLLNCTKKHISLIWGCWSHWRCKAAKHSVWVAFPITAPQVTLSVLQWMMASIVNLWCKQTTPTIKWSGPSVWVRGRIPGSFFLFVPVTLSEMGTMVKMGLCEEYFSRASEHCNMSVGEQWKKGEHRGRQREWKREATAQDALKETKAPPSVWAPFAIVVHHEPDSWVCSTMQVLSERCTSGSPVTSN